MVLKETSNQTEQVMEELVDYAGGKLTPHKKLRGGIIPIGTSPNGASGIKKLKKRGLELGLKVSITERLLALQSKIVVLLSCDVYKKRERNENGRYAGRNKLGQRISSHDASYLPIPSQCTCDSLTGCRQLDDTKRKNQR